MKITYTKGILEVASPTVVTPQGVVVHQVAGWTVTVDGKTVGSIKTMFVLADLSKSPSCAEYAVVSHYSVDINYRNGLQGGNFFSKAAFPVDGTQNEFYGAKCALAKAKAFVRKHLVDHKDMSNLIQLETNKANGSLYLTTVK